jgi:hypothetical protein
MQSPLPQLVAALLVAATPWIVLRIARREASRHARDVGQPFAPPRTFAWLSWATAIAVPVVGTLALRLPARSVTMALASVFVFAALAALGLRALHDVDRATRRSREVDSAVRVASLVPRRSRHYLSWYWRSVPLGVTLTGLALFASRLSSPPVAESRRLFLPMLFALIAPVFAWLYDTWIGKLVMGPAVAAADDLDARRRRSVRRVFVVEWVLVVGFLGLAHAVLDLDRARGGGWLALAMAAGGLLGVFGCALAVASDLSVRRYVPADAEGRAGRAT